jgi:hypothetical protein
MNPDLCDYENLQPCIFIGGPWHGRQEYLKLRPWWTVTVPPVEIYRPCSEWQDDVPTFIETVEYKLQVFVNGMTGGFTYTYVSNNIPPESNSHKASEVLKVLRRLQAYRESEVIRIGEVYVRTCFFVDWDAKGEWLDLLALMTGADSPNPRNLS